MPEPIPIPVPVPMAPPPPKPVPVPAQTRIVLAQASGALEVVVLHKRSYVWQPGGQAVLADRQLPLEEAEIPHQPLAEGRPPSWRVLPDVVGFKMGTDVVVQGSARPPRPVDRMSVALLLAGFRHEAAIFGPRRCETRNGRLAFTPAEVFTEIPLRYELAYGGRDEAFERQVMEEVERITPEDTLRRARPSAEGMFSVINPFMYPRNRFGQGYILAAPGEGGEGRQLPCIERPDDLLTPERVKAAGAFHWEAMPIPLGFDYFDPMSFPRMGMFGCPPSPYQPGAPAREVQLGLTPADFCRGNITATPPERLPGLLHPYAGHSASLGLTFPFLKGNETLALLGMDAARPELRVGLPGERPVMNVPGLEAKPLALPAEAYLLHVEVDARRLSMVWAARYRPKAPVPKDRLEAIGQALTVSWRRL